MHSFNSSPSTTTLHRHHRFRTCSFFEGESACLPSYLSRPQLCAHTPWQWVTSAQNCKGPLLILIERWAAAMKPNHNNQPAYVTGTTHELKGLASSCRGYKRISCSFPSMIMMHQFCIIISSMSVSYLQERQCCSSNKIKSSYNIVV